MILILGIVVAVLMIKQHKKNLNNLKQEENSNLLVLQQQHQQLITNTIQSKPNWNTIFTIFNNRSSFQTYLHKNLQSHKEYIFWTGGYDSSFYLCDYAQKERLVPIYIATIIDNDPMSTTRRHNHLQEINAMYEISMALHLPKTIILNFSIPMSSPTDHCMTILQQHHQVRRKICQYGAMAEISKLLLPLHVSVCVEHAPEHSMMYNTIAPYLNKQTEQLDPTKLITPNEQCLQLFANWKFPIIHLSKQDMWTIAIQKGFVSILQLTWSCWYPTKEGEPCGCCTMCKERVI